MIDTICRIIPNVTTEIIKEERRMSDTLGGIVETRETEIAEEKRRMINNELVLQVKSLYAYVVCMKERDEEHALDADNDERRELFTAAAFTHGEVAEEMIRLFPWLKELQNQKDGG